MHFSVIVAAALAGLAAALPPHQGHDVSKAQIAYTYANGTYTRPTHIKVNQGAQKLPSGGTVTDVFVSPPFDGRHYVLTECSFQTPTNKSLGAVSVRKAMTVPVNPPAAVGYVTCKTDN
ncbi:hypothetical protein BBK36DRAFT_1112122 [Trichoderma citrinoviride]|uniref:Uncharacterized protein n=1 Tax=Trichoderma citrinoviride TaxID=58853 RepID=A0A2T4BHC2_9HYPO|nr:hypothetical protein BBK36DRAFT_1112122 [Trichoderma citrinoviride]PTB68639.1 hypothetical protein BBK36DRAFT_1112122 [Trichoderma citrinoviride]